MNRCDICGVEFKTAQGLAGHKRFRHGPAGLASELETTLVSRQIHRKVFSRLSDRLADRLADAIMESHGEEMLEVYLLELSRQGVDLSFLGRRRNIRAIIVAAGQNDRLLSLIPDKPAGLLEVGHKTLIGRGLETLRECGIHDIAVVRGYQGNKIDYPEIRYYDNRDYRNTGILQSLFSAKNEMDDEFIFCYSDIIYDKDVLEQLLQDRSDVSLVVDTDYESHYRHRNQHLISEAELVIVEGDRMTQIGRNITDVPGVHGEFIGLAKFSKRGSETLKASFDRATVRYRTGAFHKAPSLEKAYFSDMIQEIIDQGYPVHHVDIRGGWAEIDTLEDFNRVNRELETVLKTRTG